jgi:hypothetical protein
MERVTLGGVKDTDPEKLAKYRESFMRARSGS